MNAAPAPRPRMAIAMFCGRRTPLGSVRVCELHLDSHLPRGVPALNGQHHPDHLPEITITRSISSRPKASKIEHRFTPAERRAHVFSARGRRVEKSQRINHGLSFIITVPRISNRAKRNARLQLRLSKRSRGGSGHFAQRTDGQMTAQNRRGFACWIVHFRSSFHDLPGSSPRGHHHPPQLASKWIDRRASIDVHRASPSCPLPGGRETRGKSQKSIHGFPEIPTDSIA
jgi:hypothetical protein